MWSKKVMSEANSCSLKKRRRRDNPSKKWRTDDVEQIIEYLLRELKNFEQPTAQVFYRKLLATTTIDANWQLLRYKVRHLKDCFLKANALLKSYGLTDTKQGENYPHVQESVMRICPYYEHLKKIFGAKHSTLDGILLNNGTADNHDGEELPFSVIKLEVADERDLLAETTETEYGVHNGAASTGRFVSTPTDGSMETSMSTAADAEIIVPNHVTANGIISNVTTINFADEIKRKQLELEELKLKIERERLEKDFLLQTRKVRLEEDRLRFEQEMKIQEFQVKKLEVASRERIAMFEIEMKYKHK